MTRDTTPVWHLRHLALVAGLAAALAVLPVAQVLHSAFDTGVALADDDDDDDDGVPNTDDDNDNNPNVGVGGDPIPSDFNPNVIRDPDTSTSNLDRGDRIELNEAAEEYLLYPAWLRYKADEKIEALQKAQAQAAAGGQTVTQAGIQVGAPVAQAIAPSQLGGPPAAAAGSATAAPRTGGAPAKAQRTETLPWAPRQ